MLRGLASLGQSGVRMSRWVAAESLRRGPCSVASFARLSVAPRTLQSGLPPLRRVASSRLVAGKSTIDGAGGNGTGGKGGGGGGGGSGGGGGGEGGNGRPQSGNIFAALWAAYLGSLESHPWATKIISAAVLNGLGDAICQIYFSDAPWDWARFARFVFLGGALVAPVLHTWYDFLGRAIKAGGAMGATLRLILDQFFFAPIFIAGFMACLMTLEGNSKAIVPKLEQDLWDAVVANWKLWLPTQFLNFRFVPGHLQVLVANIVALAWNVILSFLSNRALQAAPAPAPAAPAPAPASGKPGSAKKTK